MRVVIELKPGELLGPVATIPAASVEIRCGEVAAKRRVHLVEAPSQAWLFEKGLPEQPSITLYLEESSA